MACAVRRACHDAQGLAARWFRGGIYDTKHISRLPAVCGPLFGGDTWLSKVFESLAQRTGGGSASPGESIYTY